MYALQRGAIQAQQFAGGGRVLPLGPGRIDARQNIPTQPNGDNVLATVRVGEVILNEEQQRRLGGANVLRAIGVPGFAKGGRIGPKPFPVLNPPSDLSFLRNDSRDLEHISKSFIAQQKMIEVQSAAIVEMNRKINTLKVAVVASEVVSMDNDIKMASAVGSL